MRLVITLAAVTLGLSLPAVLTGGRSALRAVLMPFNGQVGATLLPRAG
jgi:hypothetical protein